MTERTIRVRRPRYNFPMKRTLILVLAAAMLVACSSKPQTETASAAAPVAQPAAQAPAAAKSGDAMQLKVSEVTGSGAKDCGRPASTDRAALDTAASCAMETAHAKKAFQVIYDMPGMSVGVAGNNDGKTFALQQVQPEGAAKSEINVTPCPSELRVAQSGRVTCFPVGTMGVPPGSANPHAGGTPKSGHGGMGMPPAGTPNPHAGNMSTKVPKSKSE